MKALKLLSSGLDNSDRRKVLGSETAKEKWDALAKIYQGSNDIKRDKISPLLQDYDNFTMGDLHVTQNNGKPFAFTSFTAEDWSKDEKNMKALKLLTSGIYNSDKEEGSW